MGKKHRELMRANFDKLEHATGDLLGWIVMMENQHQDFYRTVLEELEQSDKPEDFQLYQHLDRQYTQQMASLQAARERIIEGTAHLKCAIVHPGDALAHLKNVTAESF
jgi:hypothetical protein